MEKDQISLVMVITSEVSISMGSLMVLVCTHGQMELVMKVTFSMV
jgi:hypothetical protein